MNIEEELSREFNDEFNELLERQCPVNFICKSCAEKDHANCRGGTWCDCEHREGKTT